MRGSDVWQAAATRPMAILRALRAAGPAPTVRLRLTATYGAVFLITGAVLLTIGYALVRHDIGVPGDLHAELQKLGVTGTLPPLAPRVRGSLPGPEGGYGSIIAALRDQLRTAALHRLLFEYVLALGAMTLISVGAGWLLAGRALRPLRDITATARRVSGHNLGERIGLEGPADELKELADTIDGMLTRLDAAFASQRHFVANASHELRTPLAIMRTEVDVALADRAAGTGDLRAMGETVRETIDRCERLIEGLLTLARSEAAVAADEPADLAALAGDCLTDLRARAEDASVEVRAQLEPSSARGDARLLERLVANLIDNGIRYNRPHGVLEVSTGTREGKAIVRVRNSGPRIDPVLAGTLTEPFRRAERSGDGFGLGLSIVRSVVTAHRGSLCIEAPDTGGLDVLVELPAGPSHPNAGVPKERVNVPTALMPS